MPLISVVIPAFKAEKYIKETIESVLAQTGVDTEIIVVEDGIFDNTCKVVKKYPAVHHIQLKKNSGAPKVRNTGLNAVSSEYVMFLDSDDYLEGQILLSLYSAMKHGNNQASVAFGKCKKIWDATGKISLFTPPTNETTIDVLIRWLNGQSGPNPSAVLWKTSEIRRIGGWNEVYTKNQDGELIIRAFLNNCSVAQSYEGYGVYRMHENFSISKCFNKQSFKNQEQLEFYVQSFIDSKKEFEILLEPLNRFRLCQSLQAHANNLDDVGKYWEEKWRANGGSLLNIPKKTIAQFILFTLYSLFGLPKGQKLFKKIQSLKNKAHG